MIIDELEKLYEEKSIYKTLFICGTDETAAIIIKELLEKNHNAIYIGGNGTSPGIAAENVEIIRKFHDSNYRIIVITIPAWSRHKNTIELYILPHQNLIALYDINEYELYAFNKWIDVANKNGNISHNLNPVVLNLDYYAT